MDARVRSLTSLMLLMIAAPVIGASSRTRNFVVTAPTPAAAQEIAHAAEQFRRDLAVEWLGQEIPDWVAPCPIVAHVSPELGAGGRTSFIFRGRTPEGWEMEIQGSRERILDSVLPHEVTHTIFATRFGQPLPRWADEGACTTVEHHSERLKQEQWLVQFLKTRRGIPFNRMFAMTEYPGDILPLYSQGYSVARFLIAQGGKPKFVEFVGTGLRTSNWTAAVRRFYGFESLGSLQLTWVDWVIAGSQEHLAAPPQDNVPETPSDTGLERKAPPRSFANQTQQVALVTPQDSAISGGKRSWYARRESTVTPQVQLGDKHPLPPSDGWTTSTSSQPNSFRR